MPSLSDILAAYGGSPDPENPSSGQITPGLVLRAIGHTIAPGQVAPPVFDPDQVDPTRGSAFTPAKTATDYATELSRGKTKIDPLETMLGVAGGSPATFIGPGAATWNRAAAAEAERMLAAGASRREIEAKTGTSFTAAMQPQQERSDASMTVDMNRVARAIMDKQEVPAGEVYKNWHLFTDYPDMAHWPIDFHDPIFARAEQRGQTIAGGLDMATNPPTMILNPKELTSAQDIRSTGAHELGGHGVSRIEGFPSGGGFETPEVVQQAERTILPRVQAFKTTIQDVKRRASDWAMEQADQDPGSAAALVNRYFELNPADAQAMKEALVEQAKYNRGRMFLEEKFKAYRTLAGENDARNIQTRLDMTPEQLAATSREDTQDVPFADQLIRFQNYGEPIVRVPPEPPNVPPTGLLNPLRAPTRAAPTRTPPGPSTQEEFPFSADLPSFSERMAGARDVAFAGRQRGTGNILPRSTANEAPLLAPGETMGDLQGALTPGMAPAQESIADLGRRSFRERLGLDRPNLQLSAELPPEMGDVSGPITGVGRPYIRPENAPLFDYSRLSDVPNVPQRDLPRFVPPQGVPEATQRLAEPANLARVNRAVRAGEEMGGREWYNTDPLRQAFEAELGNQGDFAYRHFLNMVTATSPQTKIPENIRNASYYYGQTMRGDPIPERYLEGGNWRIVPGTQAPYPYSQTLPLHVQNIENVTREGLPVLQNPKPSSFVENLMGNQQPVTIDTHNMRLLTGGRSADVPKPNEYGFLERVQQEEAKKLGMTPAQYQASAWVGAGAETGLKSPTDPFLKVFENRVALTAERRGQTKAQVLRDFIRGQAPLLSLTPAAVLLGQAQPAPEPAQ